MICLIPKKQLRKSLKTISRECKLPRKNGQSNMFQLFVLFTFIFPLFSFYCCNTSKISFNMKEGGKEGRRKKGKEM
jgi:hypothetical protein